MIEKLKTIGARFRWIGEKPIDQNKFILIIPQYNEFTNNDSFLNRLRYFDAFSKRHQEEIDVVIVDDGSSDDSLKIIEEYVRLELATFYIASVYPNTKKVGAIYFAVESLNNQYVILSDFDTDLVGIENNTSQVLRIFKSKSSMGGYFRMLPFEGRGLVFMYQQMEYSILRSFYGFHKSENSVTVMPGAGAVYDRSILLKIYSTHSGLLSGEDREATLIGLKLGYKTYYIEGITALTRPPVSCAALVKQRIRWNLGYIETFNKENAYYWDQVKKQSKAGTRFIMDFVWVVIVLLFPLGTVFLFFLNWFLFLKVYSCLYLIGILWCLLFLIVTPQESLEFKKNRVLSAIIFPVFKIYIDCISWNRAFIVFFKKKKAGFNGIL
jgi:cellulose synthase/poly-beta-1,6-N-acetylglucosamine synthase-like glycosyltransferase